jgi:uncharacterized protein
MKIAVVSDTHGNFAQAIEALEKVGGIDIIVHLGDLVEDAILIELALERHIVKLAGNCDRIDSAPREVIFEVGETLVFATHGDGFGAKAGLGPLLKHALRLKATLVLFGHTHYPSIETRENILFVNPGSLNIASGRKSIALVNLENGSFSAEIVELQSPANSR